jgi:WD40 repeat protein
VERLQAGDPSQVGPYRLLGRLGEGGMGQVFLGESPGGRKVAIKVVRARYANDPEFRRRFTREVAAARQVGGFHTAAVVDADPGAESPWMATAYIPGQSLADAVAQRGPLDRAAVGALGAALAEGLVAIHACGITHRDLKPSNVILADDGPRIIDFGIAKGADATAITASNALIGTLRYMSPEQLDGREVTPQSDVFSLGSILAYAATGHDPFGAATIPAVINRILNDPPQLDPLTGDLRAIISACLAKDPGRRPRPAELLARLRLPEPPRASPAGPESLTVRALPAGTTAGVTLAGQDQRARPGTTQAGESSPMAGPSRRRRHRARTALAATGTIAAAGLAYLGAVQLGAHSANSAPPPQTRPASPASATGALTRVLTDPASANLWSVAFAPGGSTLATADGNGHAYLWNIATARVTASVSAVPAITPAGAANGVWSVAFGPDGTTLAAGDTYARTFLWKTTAGKITATLTDPVTPDPKGQHVNAVAFTPDGTMLATGSLNGHAYLWNIAAGTVTAALADPASEGVSSTAFSPDGAILAVGDRNGHAYLWNTAKRTITAALTDPASQGVNSVAFSRDGAILAVGDGNGRTYLWNTAMGTIITTLSDPTGSGIDSVAFSPEGVILAVGDGNGRTYLWNTATRKITAALTDPASQGVNSVAFTRDGALLATGDGSGSAYVWYITYH